MAGLGHAVVRVGEGGGGRRGAEPAQSQLAREQVGADEAQRPYPQEQQVVANERGDRAMTEERRRAVAEQRIGEGEAERVRVEGVGVEQVQRVVQHRVPDPRDLPGGAHRVAEVGGDPARHVQHERPARQHRQQDAGEDHPQQLRAPDRGRGGPPSLAPLDGGGRGALNQRARHSPRSIREASAVRRSRGMSVAAHGVVRLGHAVGSIYVTLSHAGLGGGVRGRRGGVRGDRAATPRLHAGRDGRRRARARAGGGRAAGGARSLRRRARRRLERGRSGRADRPRRCPTRC